MPGTPATTPRLGIPRIASTDTDDVPRDLNAAADRVDQVAGRFESGPIASRPSAGAGIIDRYYYANDVVGPGGVTGVLYRDAGGASPTWTAVNPGTRVISTALPGSPVTGQEILFQDASVLGPANRVWPLRYDGTKWVPIGAIEIYAEGNVGTTVPLNSTAYTGISGSPSITVPVAGDYLVEVGARINTGSAQTALVSYTVGGTAASDNDAARVGTNLAGSLDVTTSRKRLKTGIAASATLTVSCRGLAAVQNAFGDMWISAKPVRLG